MKFYRCNHCGNIFMVMDDGKVTPICCGESMELLKAGVTDGAAEKHVPVIERNGDKVTVKVGSVPHPMLDEHYIEWVVLTQGDNIQIAKLHPADKPQAEFTVTGDGALTAYEYCNLHGLWTSEETV